MYEIYTANAKTEKMLEYYLKKRNGAVNKLQKLRQAPRTEIGAHPLHGRLSGKWSCWLGSNIRMIYSIDDKNKRIIVEAVGTHQIY